MLYWSDWLCDDELATHSVIANDAKTFAQPLTNYRCVSITPLSDLWPLCNHYVLHPTHHSCRPWHRIKSSKAMPHLRFGYSCPVLIFFSVFSLTYKLTTHTAHSRTFSSFGHGANIASLHVLELSWWASCITSIFEVVIILILHLCNFKVSRYKEATCIICCATCQTFLLRSWKP